MKKIGLLIFIAALIVGVAIANIFSFGKSVGNIFSCNVKFRGEKGSGNVRTEKREVPGFKNLDISNAFEVDVAAGKDFGVEIEGDDNLLPLITTEVEGDVLVIRTEKGFNTSNPLKIRISAPDIESLELSGASKVNVSNLNNDSFKLDSSGASKISLQGVTGEFEVHMSGASKLDAERLTAENVSVESSGASNAFVFVNNELRADLSGATNVTYSGNPKSVTKKISGPSSVKQK